MLCMIHEVVETSSGVMLDDLKTRTLIYWAFFNIVMQYISHRVESINIKAILEQKTRGLF